MGGFQDIVSVSSNSDVSKLWNSVALCVQRAMLSDSDEVMQHATSDCSATSSEYDDSDTFKEITLEDKLL